MAVPGIESIVVRVMVPAWFECVTGRPNVSGALFCPLCALGYSRSSLIRVKSIYKNKNGTLKRVLLNREERQLVGILLPGSTIRQRTKVSSVCAFTSDGLAYDS